MNNRQIGYVPMYRIYSDMGMTNARFRQIFWEFDHHNLDYQWIEKCLLREGAKKPRVNAEKFLDEYFEFRRRMLERELDVIRNATEEFRAMLYGPIQSEPAEEPDGESIEIEESCS